jgi:hypothetical protein
MNPPNGNMLAAVVNADVNYYATDYNDYILRPVSEFEISTLLKVKEGLIDAGHATSFVYKNIKNINSEQNIAKDISNVASGFYDNYTSKLADVLFASSATKLIAVTKPHTSFLGVFFRNVKNKTSTLFVNIFNAFKDMFTGTIYATNELCINKTCINETQLQVLLKISASYPSNPPQN